ncbi:MAG: hypothetical protein FJ271_00695 [Planctomycetes bacterium]|nr:hypothetical protein [Planctomycetota bacterium]
MGEEEEEAVLFAAYSNSSRRHAMLTDNGVVGVLYLHAPSDDPERTGDIEASCFVFNRVEPINLKDVKNFRPGPPPIATGYAARRGCLSPARNT